MTVALCNGELLWPINFPVDDPKKQLVPGYDVAGIVAIAPSGSPYPAGTRVHTRTNRKRTACAAEYAILTTDEIAIPDDMDFASAASIPMSAMTAWQMLFEHAGVDRARLTGGASSTLPKTRVLITAASGAVGVWAVQLAKLSGLEIIATCGPTNVDLVRRLGADVVLNYRETSILDWTRASPNNRVDLVLDCIGKQSLREAWYALRPNATIIGIYEPPDNQRPANLEATIVRPAKSEFFIMEPYGSQLAAIDELYREGKVAPFVDSVWPMEEFEAAFKKTDGGHAVGKVVLRIAREQTDEKE